MPTDTYLIIPIRTAEGPDPWVVTAWVAAWMLAAFLTFWYGVWCGRFRWHDAEDSVNSVFWAAFWPIPLVLLVGAHIRRGRKTTYP